MCSTTSGKGEGRRRRGGGGGAGSTESGSLLEVVNAIVESSGVALPVGTVSCGID